MSHARLNAKATLTAVLHTNEYFTIAECIERIYYAIKDLLLSNFQFQYVYYQTTLTSYVKLHHHVLIHSKLFRSSHMVQVHAKLPALPYNGTKESEMHVGAACVPTLHCFPGPI